MAHHCKNALITCMDFRLFNGFIKWMKEQGYAGDCDIISLAGAGKGIVDGGEAQSVLLKQLDISCNLHQSEKIILLHHSDCGAYAQSYKFANAEEEKKKQLADMNKAKKIIVARYSETEVELIWAQLKDKNGKEIVFTQINTSLY